MNSTKTIRREYFGNVKSKNSVLSSSPLNSDDRKLLEPLILRSKILGYSPTVSEVPEAAKIKSRFGLWKTALSAAGLPPLNDPEQQRLRLKAKQFADSF